MPKFTQADADYLVAAKKVIHRKIEDNTDWQRRGRPRPVELRVTYEIRRKDRLGEYIGLRFHACKDLGNPDATWGTSLKWPLRIRGIDKKWREDIIRNGLVVGKIRGWHEHVWTDADQDKNIVDANSIIKNEDMRAVIEACMDHWNIEGYGHQERLEEQHE